MFRFINLNYEIDPIQKKINLCSFSKGDARVIIDSLNSPSNPPPWDCVAILDIHLLLSTYTCF